MFFEFNFLTFLIALVVIAVAGGLFVTVNQGMIGVVTMFGKYRRILYPGLSVKIPFFEVISRRVSIQNQSIELQFQAITQDQANVNFKAMLLYAVIDQTEETIKNVAFKFIDFSSLMQALNRTVEGSVRGFVALKKQNEILGLRRDIVNAVKDQLDEDLKSWGYHLIDMQLNDITFDDVIVQSMAQVVASSNLRAAAENEAQALLIRQTKAAEADGLSIRIGAEAEREGAGYG
jgi:regulator of protease activity HflC (stomatin/prohibitin superfamily)